MADVLPDATQQVVSKVEVRDFCSEWIFFLVILKLRLLTHKKTNLGLVFFFFGISNLHCKSKESKDTSHINKRFFFYLWLRHYLMKLTTGYGQRISIYHILIKISIWYIAGMRMEVPVAVPIILDILVINFWKVLEIHMIR